MIKAEMHQDDFEAYEELFDVKDRKARRSRKPKARHIPKKEAHEVLGEIAETAGLEGGFEITYQPSKYEQGWLLSSLEGFYDQHLITDVLAQVRGGKEATVYCCEAHPSTGVGFLAAKIYRPRMFRQLRNDKVYRQGRDVLTADGRPVKKTDHRLMRALNKKTDFGVQVSHTSWLMYEYTTLGRLFAAGAAVPQPIASSDNAILMAYCGDAEAPALPLSEIRLEEDEAKPLFDEVLRNVELMLQQHMIHGDLSAYNILYWDGKITLIDFPQVTNSQTNDKAYFILQRDIKRVCEYFARQGVRSDPEALTRQYWDRYVRHFRFDPELGPIEEVHL